MNAEKTEHWVFITGLGCAKNWVDTEILTAGLLRAGFGLAVENDEADLWLINSCGFIRSARDELAEYLAEARAWKRKRKTRKIVVCGCLTAWDRDGAWRKDFPFVDAWLAPDDLPQVPAYVCALFSGTEPPAHRDAAPFLYDDQTDRVQLTPGHFAWVKISDGCDNCCSYCAIPKIRGKNRSRTIQSVEKEVRNLLALGVKEIGLIGQDITRFGEDREGGETLMDLIRTLDALPGDFRLRILYLHPARYPEELTDFYNTARHLVPYLEMPVQHISDSLLTAMNRKVASAKIRRIFEDLRTRAPHVTLRTTFIVGHPGETEADFEELYNFVKTVRFDRMGAFIFEPEPGTPSASMPNPVPPETARARFDRLMTLQHTISLARNQAKIGTECVVLIDDYDEERRRWIGRTEGDAPDIDQVVYVQANRKRIEAGSWVKVAVTEADAYSCSGKAVQVEATLAAFEAKGKAKK